MEGTKGNLMPTGIYNLYDMNYAMLTPVRAQMEAMRNTFQAPTNPLSFTAPGRFFGALADVGYRLTKRFDQPKFGIKKVIINGKEHRVHEKHPMDLPFCRLKHFTIENPPANRSKLLIGAPISGHFSTLLRNTVEALLPYHDVYITDWKNARDVPLSKGYFDLDDCIQYYMDFLRFLGPDVHTLGVCQPSVPILLAVALMNKLERKNAPRSMTLMGGPIDTRINPTEVNKLAMDRPLEWFEKNAIAIVPPWYQGGTRQVYPGFLQLNGFVSMNIERHIDSYFKYFQSLVNDDQPGAKKHREFYDEYLAVMDIPAEFYLQTVDRIFQRHLLPKNEYVWRDTKVDMADITDTALLCIEGELDDISAVGQTKAAIDLCVSLRDSMKEHHLQLQAGHYGLFSGTRWREEVRPVMSKFIEKHDKHRRTNKKKSSPKTNRAKEMAKNHPPKKLNAMITPLVETAAIIG
jgi:poly(3-hydroxybutyrate) depolymerase